MLEIHHSGREPSNFEVTCTTRSGKKSHDESGSRVQSPYAPQGSTSLLPKLSVTSKVSAPTSYAWVRSRVRFRSSEDVTLLEFTSPVDREYMHRLSSQKKEGKKEQPPSHLSYREVKTLIHNKKKAIFHCKTEGYNPNQDALHQLARHQQTIIFRLRTGHCRLNSHLKRIGVKTSAQCPCGEADQTPEHYLQSCSLHQQARQQIWPTCVSLKTKLWGSAEDLFLTSRYAALTGERI